jgi:putative hydrolase of the HAD superfamily
MIIKVDSRTCLVFDLDDTLYCEIDYLKSAFREISESISVNDSEIIFNEIFSEYISGGNPFLHLLGKYGTRGLTLEKLLYLYRNHKPSVLPAAGVVEFLEAVRSKEGRTGIITDGRSITQRNKIKALGIGELIDLVIISEEEGVTKPGETLYRKFMDGRDPGLLYYFGDNPEKDFITPKKLGWKTVGLHCCKTIHRHSMEAFPLTHRPDIVVNSFSEIGVI